MLGGFLQAHDPHPPTEISFADDPSELLASIGARRGVGFKDSPIGKLCHLTILPVLRIEAEIFCFK